VTSELARKALKTGLRFTEASFAVYAQHLSGGVFSDADDVLLRDGCAVNHGVKDTRYNFACRIRRPDPLLRQYLLRRYCTPCRYESFAV
jgi:hypothetical protein